ncbi:MAG: hypothetical protein CO135_00065, partial [Candidatus Levybacteria bacterium CG_4_9_14_3_um_filter_35_16]
WIIDANQLLTGPFLLSKSDPSGESACLFPTTQAAALSEFGAFMCTPSRSQDHLNDKLFEFLLL